HVDDLGLAFAPVVDDPHPALAARYRGDASTGLVGDPARQVPAGCDHLHFDLTAALDQHPQGPGGGRGETDLAHNDGQVIDHDQPAPVAGGLVGLVEVGQIGQPCPVGLETGEALGDLGRRTPHLDAVEAVGPPVVDPARVDDRTPGPGPDRL